MRDDGGPAFPSEIQDVRRGRPGMSLREYFAIHAPEPTAEQIEFEGRRDQTANPHGDSHKPKRRTRSEIIAQLKYAYADALITEGKK